MTIPFRRVSAPAVLACALALSGCAAGPLDSTAASNETASAEASSFPTMTASAAPTISQDSPTDLPSSSPTPTAQAETAAALQQTFTSPDGSFSFQYPAGWAVAAQQTESSAGFERYGWIVNDAQGQSALTMTVETDVPPAGPPPLTVVMPQGPVPGVVDASGAAAQVIVSATPGHDGSSTSVGYGIASATGMAMDATRLQIPLGNGYRLSFGGGESLGSDDRVNLEAEASRLAASPRFRNEILPILKSLTATPSVAGGGSTGGATPDSGGGISFVAPEIAEATCVGGRYSYDNLQGLSCDEAKAVLQEVSDTGTPFGARGRETTEYTCFWSSLGEKAAGHADVTCRHQSEPGISLDAHFLRPVISGDSS
ncbi:hypothetical protein [Kocuria rosea]|uniref:hypothetical protein n=1 Tax=Kocuria rosea TaxID=1275 RepID=UPI00126A40E5|nr:hypothetical protein [Kocuria polaris]